MDKLDPIKPPPGDDEVASDLARRLARYRRRVAAEGRPRSVKVIDRAIKDADRKPKRSTDEPRELSSFRPAEDATAPAHRR